MTDTPATFSREEAALIRDMVLTPGTTPTCPRCDEALELGSVSMVRGERVRRVSCDVCRRTMVVKEPDS